MSFRTLAVLSLTALLFTMILPATAQAPSLPAEDDSIYPGYFWGAAGIADALLKLIDLSVLSENQEAQATLIIQNAIDGIWNQRYTLPSGDQLPTWQKVPDGEIYPGKKYGAAGIIDMLVNAYSVLGNVTYLEMANASSYELIAQSSHFELPHWPYSYLHVRGSVGVSITDWNYGNLGIIDAILDVYSHTNDSRLLQFAKDAAMWIFNVSNPVEINNIIGKIIPWYASDEVVNNMYTTYGRGNAAAIPVLYRLANVTDNSNWSDWAEFITIWIIENQQDDGKWTQIPSESAALVPLDQEKGQSGTILGLIQTQNYVNFAQINQSISKGIKWLQSQFLSNETVQIYPTFDRSEKASHSLYAGMVGVLQTIRKSGITTTTLSDGYNWIVNEAMYPFSKGTNQLLGIYPTTDMENYVDLSYTDGLSGVMVELAYASVSDLIQLDTSLFSKFIQTLEVYQLESGLWNRQIDVPVVSQLWASIPSQLKIIAGLSILGLGVITYRKWKSKSQ